ncbi:acyl-coenzyme A thioesterase 13-like [Cylas formicarius]|uniref:acyl-coenzyme A thioesterase 13-like n=1 Tax=Cylas formicarius TaxID=197179 RepID=UPI0029586392|nr:acyl-coenzyme A thioesterase 13-like [Cylas formicarius]
MGFKPLSLMQHIKSTKGFDKILRKVNILSMENGNGLAELTIAEEHTNLMGTLHNGFSALLVDHISSFALTTHKAGDFPHVSINMHLTYYRTANLGDTIQITSKAVSVGQTLAFLDVLIKNKSTSDLIVKASHTAYITRHSW